MAQLGEEKWFMDFFIQMVSVLLNEELVLHLLVYHQITSMTGKTEWSNKQTLFLMKLAMYGVTHVCAIDGYSAKVVSHALMPVKNNLLIYDHVYR